MVHRRQPGVLSVYDRRARYGSRRIGSRTGEGETYILPGYPGAIVLVVSVGVECVQGDYRDLYSRACATRVEGKLGDDVSVASVHAGRLSR